MRLLYYALILSLFISVSCSGKKTSLKEAPKYSAITPVNKTSIIILGTIQDAGSPQIGCNKECCINLFEHPDKDRKVTSLGLIDVPNKKTYLFEATPDIGVQMKMLAEYGGKSSKENTDGIFLTHAHIGHYSGLMFLGKEAMDAKDVPIYAMPRMKEYLSNNGPWSQLVTRNNIELMELQNEEPVQLGINIKVTPFIVPHRDEYSETVGYKIEGPNKTALFIPDIDKWEKWGKNIVDEIKKVDYAFVDATFYDSKEINNRDISEIPHPFIVESFQQFENLEAADKNKVIFIHFNHTNPVINPDSDAAKTIINHGFRIGKINDVFEL
ncbi:MBL fold metallo-hydrolase [Tenacibaculum sp.]|uniref:MBL fold metallo-hydrolase n=1 Tax=Tenacibaculum sp. TaxID=1906242 RepID=UPI003D147BDB